MKSRIDYILSFVLNILFFRKVQSEIAANKIQVEEKSRSQMSFAELITTINLQIESAKKQSFPREYVVIIEILDPEILECELPHTIQDAILYYRIQKGYQVNKITVNALDYLPKWCIAIKL